jgi:hypothetical protein
MAARSRIGCSAAFNAQDDLCCRQFFWYQTCRKMCVVAFFFGVISNIVARPERLQIDDIGAGACMAICVDVCMLNG